MKGMDEVNWKKNTRMDTEGFYINLVEYRMMNEAERIIENKVGTLTQKTYNQLKGSVDFVANIGDEYQKLAINLVFNLLNKTIQGEQTQR